MDIHELKPDHYYKAICADIIKVFKLKEFTDYNNCIIVHESVMIIGNAINVNTWTTLTIDSSYTIEEVDEKVFYSLVKLFTIAKKAILSIAKR